MSPHIFLPTDYTDSADFATMDDTDSLINVTDCPSNHNLLPVTYYLITAHRLHRFFADKEFLFQFVLLSLHERKNALSCPKHAFS